MSSLLTWNLMGLTNWNECDIHNNTPTKDVFTHSYILQYICWFGWTTLFALFSYVGENMVEVAILAPLAILIEGPIWMWLAFIDLMMLEAHCGEV